MDAAKQMVGITRIQGACNEQTDRENGPSQAPVIGFRDEEGYRSRTGEGVNRHGEDHGGQWNAPTRQRQPLFANRRQRKASTVSCMQTSSGSHVMPNTFSALVLL